MGRGLEQPVTIAKRYQESGFDLGVLYLSQHLKCFLLTA